MKILIFNWRDIRNPRGGGAEVYVMELARRWVHRGHQVTLFCSFYQGGLKEEVIEGVQVIRRGNPWTVYWQAYRFYQKEALGKFDVIIDSVNTLPFFTPFYVKEKRRVIFYQLAREVWFYEAPFPINILGYLFEPFYLKLYRRENCVTISESTRKDLEGLGFRSGMPVVSPGIFAATLKSLPLKESQPTLIYVGRLKKSKRVHHILKAFSMIRDEIPSTRLWIVGSGDDSYEAHLKRHIYRRRIEGVIFWGRVSEDKKMELMKKAHLILVASVREGWGIIVMEAAAMGTPAVVYNVPGLRDSVRHQETGIVTIQNRPQDLSEEVVRLLRSSQELTRLSSRALDRSRTFQWDTISDELLRLL